MTLDKNEQRSKSAQVGFLMRSYREAFFTGRGKKGLSQEELLRRMGEVDPEYSNRFSHATVSRWESGSTRPTVERLRTFGRALSLAEEDVAGLILLAGLAPDYESAVQSSRSGDETLISVPVEEQRHEAGDWLPPAPSPSGQVRSLSWDVLRFLAFRFLLPGALIAGFHCLLWTLGWRNSWMPELCVAFSFVVVLGQGLIWPDETAGLRDFYSISVFFVLTTPLLQFAPLGLDFYNFHIVPGFGGTMIPSMLALLSNLGLAWLAGLIFFLLWKWRYRDGTAIWGAVKTAALVTNPGLGVVYVVVVLTTNFSVTVQLAVVFAVLPMAFALLLVFQDRRITFTERDRQMFFSGLVAAACVSVTLGIAVMMAIYFHPDFPSVLPDHNLVQSWQLDFEALGYTRAEALERLNFGYMWHAMTLTIYMACVVGGRLFIEIHRMQTVADQIVVLPRGQSRAA